MTTRRLGELSGYPETAIDAYCAAERTGDRDHWLIKAHELPVGVRRSHAFMFVHFRLSRRYWKKELEEAKRWSDNIKRSSPLIHREYVLAMRQAMHGMP